MKPTDTLPTQTEFKSEVIVVAAEEARVKTFRELREELEIQLKGRVLEDFQLIDGKKVFHLLIPKTIKTSDLFTEAPT